MDDIKFTDIIMPLIALYGAGLSTYNIIKNKQKAKADVKLIAIKEPAPYPRVGYLKILAINNGSIPISIIYSRIENPRKPKESLSYAKLNRYIEPSKEEIVTELRLPAIEDLKLKKFEYIYFFISAYDNFGNRYRLKPGVINAAKRIWLKKRMHFYKTFTLRN